MSIQRATCPNETRGIVRAWQATGLSVGLVPTMGALHEGHLSLVRASAAECDRTVVSIYVNPTQFAPDEDLAQYPRDLDEDCRLAEGAGADLVFCPDTGAVYPDGHCTFVDQRGLTEVLEGEFRPSHFRGVLTVVLKLLNIAPADRAYFGRKDFQQTVVVRQMVRDLNVPTEVRVMPTVREPDGLAMSSRNRYLSEEERRQAACLHRALTAARERYAVGETAGDALCGTMGQVIAEAPMAQADYVELVDCETLEPVDVATDRAVATLAVRIGRTRLIDNMPLAD